MLKDNRGDNTGQESARERASTSASAKRDAGRGAKTVLMNRVLHENVSYANSALIG